MFILRENHTKVHFYLWEVGINKMIMTFDLQGNSAVAHETDSVESHLKMTSSERLESFQEAYTKVLNQIVVQGKLKQAHNYKVAQALKSVYDQLAAGGSGADALNSQESPLYSVSSNYWNFSF